MPACSAASRRLELVSAPTLVFNGRPPFAGVGALSVAMDARFMDVLPGQADVGGGGSVPAGNVGDVLVPSIAASAGNLAPVLRRVVFVGEATLGAGLDLQRVGLHAVGGACRS